MFFKKMRKFLKDGKRMKQENLTMEQDTVIPEQENMDSKRDIQILQGDVNVKMLDKTDFLWFQTDDKRNILVFEKAFEISYENSDKGIRDCTYMVRGRTFTDLSCMKGETIKEIEGKEHTDDVYEVRAYPDGGRFIYHSIIKPTFDSGDREWDHYGALAVYADEQGINLIHCSYGYKIPRIKIYLGLKKAGPFFAPILEYLQCSDFGTEVEPQE